ncbi:hypothetical protein H6F74_18050 [Trichocoleus sp. FACHB-90]|jgi:hypothetical protein|uniref:Uncharacterized protein n=1 Tax=Funiculus sociatus GB2-A5 TaxID=2933946 RepID=A0ABV0JU82_9CYAN|nr:MULTISPECIES: hypothetical protein [unclassified Trichocoleus]MBD1832479.1 hypothetical protein [Cyanobacteria bacterium FACHB-472]MBD1908500.1 hypothetical protein [Trichocoleus sp. FACHB-832]MBD1928133.1 hypothetical protein [Trichocoleus sp. FACHB-90]MBD1934467.1 hypothetical protein [Trichocoleus sp. FACHB-69]MBD2001787.1 hypothetical protein [Trichocoleus sp. FACHB-40]
MAKRRNPKKEKAQRNQAYARKFRKRQTTGRFSKFRRQRAPGERNNEEEDSDKMGAMSGMGAMGGGMGAMS